MKKETEIKPAKLCYEHIGGKLGMLLKDAFAGKKRIAKTHPADKHYYITEEGKEAFKKMGIDLSQIAGENPETNTD